MKKILVENSVGPVAGIPLPDCAMITWVFYPDPKFYPLLGVGECFYLP